ncbi:aspartyl-phosphate phosphatase Spo0E family protein [Clostridium sp. Mt-5]|uniref:Aspartyl-phosphate phosphatase Spo0E family protein n=1 Tax=Clostridium moutaii TaxID=3240932 RepID=A0ABV4BU39_9CLOT
MSRIDRILKEVEKLRTDLLKAIRQNGNLLDSEIIAESQKLDLILNEYSKAINKRMDK